MSQFAIHPPHRIFYSLSIAFCVDSAIRSLDVVAEVMQHIESTQDHNLFADADSQLVLNALQNVIIQGAALSRYFWPVDKKYKTRGVELRKQYSVIESSPLKSRELRNSIEHFDEKLDDYLQGGIIGNIVPHYFGPQVKPDGIPRHFFRAYFTDTGVFEILGKRYEIEPIAVELWRMHEKS